MRWLIFFLCLIVVADARTAAVNFGGRLAQSVIEQYLSNLITDLITGHTNPANSFSSSLESSSNPDRSILEADFFMDKSFLGFGMELYLGTPLQRLNVTVAANSEFVWVACSPCINCNTYAASQALFDNSSSSSYTTVPCSSSACSGYGEITTSCGTSSCSYNVSYSDGELGTDLISATPTPLNLTFGCGRDNGGLLGLLNSSGIVGFARSSKSFIGQWKQLGHKAKFVYCVPFDTLSGKIFVGGYDFANRSVASSMAYTPMITGPADYSISVVAISHETANKTTIRVPVAGRIQANGTGGTIIDTTIALSYFAADSYSPLVESIRNSIANLVPVSNDDAKALGVSLCYNISANSAGLPQPDTLTYELDGGARIEVPAWVLAALDDVNATVCLAVGNSTDVGFGFNVIGTYQQLDLTVEYDLELSRIGFGMAGCSASMVMGSSAP